MLKLFTIEHQIIGNINHRLTAPQNQNIQLETAVQKNLSVILFIKHLNVFFTKINFTNICET